MGNEGMDIALTVIPNQRGDRYDVRVSAPVDTSWADLRRHLLDSGRVVPDPAYVGRRRLTDDALVGSIGYAGVVAAAPTAKAASEFVRLECIRGPHVGAGAAIGATPVTIGRGKEVTLRLDDPDVSRTHCEVRLDGGRVLIRDTGSTNGTLIDGQPVADTDGTELRSGQTLTVGSSVLALSRSALERPDPVDGWFDVRRPPTRINAPKTIRLSPPTAPTPHSRRTMPWLVALLPLVVAGLLAWWMKALIFLAFAVLSPIMMLAQHVSDRRDGRQSKAQEAATYAKALARHRNRLAEALAAERRLRQRSAPALHDAIHATEIAAADDRAGLWHRHPDEFGYLHWRLGDGVIESALQVADPTGETSAEPLRDAPVCVDLVEHRVVGVICRPTVLPAVLDSLLAQLAAWHSPRHLRLVLLTDPSTAPSDVDWLPHIQPSAAEPALIVDPHDRDHVRRVLDALPPLEEEQRSRPPHTIIIMVTDESASAPAELANLIEEPDRHGVALVHLTANRADLPDRAHPVIDFNSRVTATITNQPHPSFRPDLPAADSTRNLFREVGAHRDVSSDRSNADPPLAVNLADLWPTVHGSPLLSRSAICAQWQERKPAAMSAVLGASGNGPMVVDLCVDGPHALLAGTTGAGKSELLQTFVASLAAANPPDALTFVLIDYKGGAAFRECADLPHTVGMVTDLDGHLTERALTSLSAELHRRERVLSQVGAKDLDDYHRDRARPLLARLVLVIDEFRVLAEELPDFIDGLVRLATVGRSLGVHLVLATQRPAGVVSADIRANVNLRIALRVREEGDSHDVVEAADAARISAACPGRAVVRSGGGELRLFQTARVTVAHEIGRMVSVGERGRPLAVPQSAGPTIIGALVPMLNQASLDTGRRPPPAPWLAPLPTVLADTEIDCTTAVSVRTESDTGYRFALLDCPQHQDQVALGWDPNDDQHLAIVGGPRSGRTTAVRSILHAVFASTRQAHCYLLDFGRALADLAEHPLVAASVGASEVRRIERVLEWLVDQIAARQKASEVPVARLLVVIDGWDSLADLADAGGQFRLLDLVNTILRDGTAADVHVVATGGRSLMTSRSLPLFRSQVVLAMPDHDDITTMGVPRNAIPTTLPAGRGLLVPDGLELQVCTTGEPSLSPPLLPMHRIDPLPHSLTTDDLLDDEPAIGVGESGVLPIPISARGDGVCLIAGPPRSGRTTTLLTIAWQMRDRSVCWVGPSGSISLPDNTFRPSDAADLAGWLQDHPEGVVLIDDVSSVLGSEIDDLLAGHAAQASATGLALFAAGDPSDLASNFQGLAGELRRRGSGILLMPGRHDGELFAVRCPALDQPRPGNGYVVSRGVLTEVQVAQPPAVAPVKPVAP